MCSLPPTNVSTHVAYTRRSVLAEMAFVVDFFIHRTGWSTDFRDSLPISPKERWAHALWHCTLLSLGSGGLNSALHAYTVRILYEMSL